MIRRQTKVENWVPIIPVYPSKDTVVEVRLSNGERSQARWRNFKYGDNWEHLNGLHFSAADPQVIAWRNIDNDELQ